jgi:galactitol-specific phosphotransferase system IIB component
MKHSRMYIGIAVLLAVFLSGCAHQGPILLDLQYQPPQGVSAGAAKVTLGVSPFRDDRGKVASVIGKRSLESSDETNDLVVQGTTSEKVTSALKGALKARGIAEKDLASWDLTEAGIPSDGADLLVSGEIKKFWAETKSRFANTTVKAEVQLRISVADMAQKKIIRVMNVHSTMERQNVTFSTDVVESTLSDALTSAIDQIFADEELQKRLK